MPKLSILIVSWNQQARLTRCIDAVKATLPDAECIIVDNGSSPPLSSSHGKLIRSTCNLGYAGGNNLGFKACTGDFILLLNNDAYLPSRAPIDTLLQWMQLHPQTAMTQAKLIHPDGRLDACGEMLTGCGTLYHRFYRQLPTEAADVPCPVFAAKAACALLRKSAIETVGNCLFRPEFFCYYEDIDLCHRLWLAGFEVWYIPHAQAVLHEEAATASTRPQKEIWQRYLSNMLTSSLDLWGPLAWLRLAPGFYLSLLVGALLKHVHPRLLNAPRIVFQRKRSERDFFKHVLVHPPLKSYLSTLKRLSK